MATATKTRTTTTTIVGAALVVGFAAAAALGYNYATQLRATSTLTLKFNGPAATTIVKGTKTANFYSFSLTNTGGDVQINALRMTLSGLNGGRLMGSKGTKYFSNIRIVNTDNGTVVMGPKEIINSPTTAIISQSLFFNDAFLLKGGTTMNLSLVADIASNEDAASELIDKQFYASWSPFLTGDVKVPATAAAGMTDFNVNNSSPRSIIYGNQMTIVAPTGSLRVENLNKPASTIDVAGKDVFYPFASYKVTAGDEDLVIDRIAVSNLPGGDNADYQVIAVAYQGTVRGQSQISAGQTGNVDIDLTGNSITIPKGSSAEINLWAKLQNITSSMAAGGTWTGVSRSGHTPALGLASNIQTGEWTALYANKLNIRARGVQSGMIYLAPAGAYNGNKQVLRKTKPIVAKLISKTTVLTAGADKELYKFSVNYDLVHSASLKQVMFKVVKNNNVNLGKFKIVQNETPTLAPNYSITDVNTGADLKNTFAPTGTNSLILAVTFNSELQVSDQPPPTLTLLATVVKSGLGNSVATSLVKDGATPITTGYLMNNIRTEISAGSPNIYAIKDASPSAMGRIYPGTFVWSDNSEQPHLNVSSTYPSSIDWTNDTYVESLDLSTTLSD